MKVKYVVVDELPSGWDDCIFNRSDEEGAARCILCNGWCPMIKFGACPLLIKQPSNPEKAVMITSKNGSWIVDFKDIREAGVNISKEG